MADDVRELRYDVKLTINEFKERMGEIGNLTNTLERQIKDIGKSNPFEPMAKSAEKATGILAKVNEEVSKLQGTNKGAPMGSAIEELTSKFTLLQGIMRQLRVEKEALMRGEKIITDDGSEKTLQTVLVQLKAVEDEMKRIKALDLNKIIDSNQVAQFKEYTAAIDTQRKALEALDKTYAKHKAMAQSTWNKHRAEFEKANKTLTGMGFNPAENPYKQQGWVDYVKEVRESDQLRKVKENIAEIQAGIVAKQKAEIANQQKILEQEKAIADAKRKETAERIKSNIAKNHEAVNARNDAKAGNYTGNKALAQAWEKVRSDAEKWNIALSRGKQITDEELRAAQRITEEYRKQVKEIGGKAALRNAPQSPILNYDNAVSFNAASTAAREASAIANNVRHQSEEVRSYEQELRRLQAQCESLYATYRKNPSKENLQALAQSRAELQRVTKEYRQYEKAVVGASRAENEFARKAMSHFQWITTGAAIAAATAVPMMGADKITSLDYQMAGIRQVIPQIEGIEDSKQYGDVATQIKNMNAAMEQFVGTAKQFGISTEEVLDSAKSIGRMYGQGENGVTNTALFTKQAAKMAVADAFSMEEATKGLEAAMSQWNLQTEDTNKLLVRSSEIIDIWTRAAHSGAASGQDISQAIQVAGASAAQAGVSFSFFTSLVETGVRTTARSGNEIGQALKSLFVTLGSGKAEKALNLWGIKTKELGTDGVEHVRSLEKQILDISLAVSSTNKDTTKFLSTISGGKYQYSKIAALLKNYKEILRMQGVLNDGNTKGFADKQVEVQLDTIKRKTQQMKAEVDGLLMDIGRDGGIETLKWIAESFRNVVSGIRELNREAEKGGTNVLVIAKHLGEVLATLTAIKAVSAAVGAIMAKNAEKKAFLNATADYRKNGGSSTMFSGGFFADSRENGRIKGEVRAAEYLRAKQALDAETASQERNTVATGANTVATGVNTTSKVGNASAKRADAGATAAETAATATSTAANTANTASNVANKASLVSRVATLRTSATAMKVFAAAEGVATMATRTLSSVVAAFGGLPGIAAMAILTVGTALLTEADAAGEATNATQKHIDAMDEEIAKSQQALDQISRRQNAARQVAEAYNKVNESLATCSVGSEEYVKKQEQMADMDQTLAAIMGEDTKQFLTDNGFKLDAIDECMNKKKQDSLETQKENLEKAKSSLSLTKQTIADVQKRIQSLRDEIEAVRDTGKAWNWLQKVIANTKLKAIKDRKRQANELLAMANNYGSGGISGWFNDRVVDIGGGVEKLAQRASDNWNKADSEEQALVKEMAEHGAFDDSVLNEYLADQNKRLEELKARESAEEQKVAEMGLQVEEAERKAKENETNGNSIPDNNNYGKERQPRVHQGRNRKISIDYANDPLSAAIHMAAQSDKAQAYHIDEPLLRAIAARESGGDTTIMQTDGNGNLVTSDGVHLGMFQVTQSDADRFGFGSIAEPLNNAMTAVYMLAEKFDMGGNNADLWGAVKRYNGGGDPNYVEQVRANYNAQKQSFNFNGDDFGLPGSFNDDVIAGAKEELGQIYGGSNWRDIGQKVCTTFIQKALVNAGVDETTVDNLSADATNWSTAAGYAFHPYSEITSGAYVPKPGDIGLTNANAYGGKAGHVIMIGENGEGYYAAAGSGRKSAYYNTNWQTAFESSGIEGVISVNELAGKPYTTSVRGGKKKPKSINDFQLDPYAESQYKQQLVNEAADKTTLEGKIYDYYHGGESGKNKAELAVAELKLASQKAAKQLLEATFDSTNRNIKNFLSTRKDIGEMLEKRGTTWEKLVPAERKALADLAGDPSFAKQVENQEKIRVKIVETTKAIEEQKMARDEALGYMNPDERSKYMREQLKKDFELKGGSSYGEKRRMLEAQKEILDADLARHTKAYEEAKADGESKRAKALKDLQDAEAKLQSLEGDKLKNPTDEATKAVKKQREAVEKLRDSWDSLDKVGTQQEQIAKKRLDETKSEIQNVNNEMNEVSKSLYQQIGNGVTTMFDNILLQGKSFQESFKNLWRDIASFALQQLMRIALAKAFPSIFGAKATGGALATGGSIPGYADGGQTAGAITGAGTGTSDSILAYIANKDRFVYLSNGEYVMTAEATRRIGKGNLDRMNYGKYADGGALSPTPYVPHLSASVARRAQSIDRSNPNARMEELMQQQTDLLRGMGENGNGGSVVVLNTQASSQEVLKALAENPRALNAILGRNQRMGFR